jgi:hypothetical protein
MPRATVVALPIALLLTAPAVALGVAAADPSTGEPVVAARAATSSLSLADLNRGDVSRSGSRSDKAESSVLRGAEYILSAQDAYERREVNQQVKQATVRAVKSADTKLWTTAPLNLWSSPAKKAEKHGEIKPGVHVLVTGRKNLGRAEIVLEGRALWVTDDYLTTDEPTPGIGGVCNNGSVISSGVSPHIVAVHNAVCAAFPSISTYGTLRGGGGDHPLGRAVDIMVSGSMGWDVADFVRAHYAELGVTYVIYSQHIWSVERGGEGWRAMSDRGSTTANHYDHVHVSTY